MKNIFITVLLILIAFGFGFLINNQDLKLGLSQSLKETEEVVEQETGNEVEAEYFDYKSPFGFSFQYDSPLQLENSSIVLPGGYRVTSVAVVRYVKEQHCGASGLPEHCRPFLENPAIAFGVIAESLDDLKSGKLADVLDFVEPINLAGKDGIQYYMGVEGEGIVTIALPLKDSETLLIQYTFDELFDSVKNNPEVYGSAEQKRVVDNILNSLNIE